MKIHVKENILEKMHLFPSREAAVIKDIRRGTLHQKVVGSGTRQSF